MWRKVFANQLKLWTSLPLPGRKFILVRNKSLHLLNAPFVLKTPSFEFPASVSIHVHVQKFCAYIRASNLHHSLKTNTPHKGFWALHRTANKQINANINAKEGKTNRDQLSELDIGPFIGGIRRYEVVTPTWGGVYWKAIYLSNQSKL